MCNITFFGPPDLYFPEARSAEGKYDHEGKYNSFRQSKIHVPGIWLAPELDVKATGLLSKCKITSNSILTIFPLAR